MTIKSNRQVRSFLLSVSKVERQKFPWVHREESNGFLRYQGELYHLSQFERIPTGAQPGWDGVFATSMTTGIVIKVLEEGYRIGTYQC